MKATVSLAITGLNGGRHDCVAEAFDTTRNILILLYPVKALTATAFGAAGRLSARGMRLKTVRTSFHPV
jgi:hypothetical protein